MLDGDWSSDVCSSDLPWMPVVWPLKLCLPLASILLILQGLSEVLKTLYSMKTGQNLREAEADQET
jgi:TRAP-type mannitol/chloroaromatic compound transport system permease small subunit